MAAVDVFGDHAPIVRRAIGDRSITDFSYVVGRTRQTIHSWLRYGVVATKSQKAVVDASEGRVMLKDFDLDGTQ